MLHENDGQPHATDDKRAIGFAGSASLWSVDTPRDALSIAQGARQAALSDARGAHGSGAPKGERNGNYRHGFYTAKAIAERRALRALINKLAD